MPDVTVAVLPASFTPGPGPGPCSTGRAAPSRGRPGRLPAGASSAPGPGIHLTDGPHVKMKTSSAETDPGAPPGMSLGRSQPHARGAGYLQRGLARRRNLPGSRDRAGCCPCTQPAGGVGGPTGSNAQLMSAPAPPPGSSSACPKPRQRWPCCLRSKNRCCSELTDANSQNCSRILLGL